MTIKRIRPATGGIAWAKREMDQVMEWAAAGMRIDIVKLIREAYYDGAKASEVSSSRMWTAGYEAGLTEGKRLVQEDGTIRKACDNYREAKFNEMLESIHNLVQNCGDKDKLDNNPCFILKDFTMEQLYTIESFINSFNHY